MPCNPFIETEAPAAKPKVVGLAGVAQKMSARAAGLQ